MALKAENERLAKELAEAKDSYQRMLAEYANYKRRTEQEKERLGEFTKAELLGKLLTSLDNMERAIEAPAGDDYKTGVDMVLRQFRELLMGMGLEEIHAENQPFNPEVHQRRHAGGRRRHRARNRHPRVPEGLPNRRTAAAPGHGQGSQLKRDEISFARNTIYHEA